MSEAQTVADRPSVPSLDSATSIVTPQQAMRLLEARRAWTYAVGLGALCAVAVGVVAWLGGDRTAQLVHMGALGATAGVAAVFALLWRDPARYEPWGMFVIGGFAMVANGTGFYYWGVYSAFIAAVTVTGYAFASGTERRGVLVLLAIVIAMHAGIGIAQLTGVIEERALVVAAPWTSHVAQIIALVMIEAILALAIAGGLDTRAQMRRILDEHHAATRELAQRDAQLAEAHEAVRDARGPREGRYTGELLGRFRLGIVLGRGAMGEVYAAEDDRGQPCAVKILAAHLLGDEDALSRFHREARAIASLDAPNIVRMLDVSPPGAPQPYIAMEKLEGHDLAELIKQRPVRELGEVVAIVRAVAAGLDAAHAEGVVHRDLKPANVFAATTASGVVWKILDFGVSKIFAADTTLTVGNLVGTPGYMAPEQARGEAIDRRADVYALGVVAYRLLTGRPAVVPGDFPQMIHEVVFRMPPRPSDLVAVTPQVEATLAVALAKTASDRFATAGEFAAALAEAASGFESAGIRERAEAIVCRTPWGQWARRASRAMTAHDKPA